MVPYEFSLDYVTTVDRRAREGYLSRAAGDHIARMSHSGCRTKTRGACPMLLGLCHYRPWLRVANQCKCREDHVTESLGISDAIVIAIEENVDQLRGQPAPSKSVDTCTG